MYFEVLVDVDRVYEKAIFNLPWGVGYWGIPSRCAKNSSIVSVGTSGSASTTGSDEAAGSPSSPSTASTGTSALLGSFSASNAS